MAVILLALGLLLTGVDIYRVSEISYPSFHLDGMVGAYELSPSIKIYTGTNILGQQLRLDVLPDLLGCILILAGVCMLLKYNRQYWLGIPVVLLTAICGVILRCSGFFEQGPSLVVWIIIFYFAQGALELLMEYLVLYATVGITDSLVNRATNTRMLFGWWITVFCRVFMIFLNFVGHVQISRVYQVILVVASLFYLVHLIRSKKYVGTCEPVKIGERKLRDKKEKLEA